MQLPSRIEDLFTQNFNGFRAVKLRTATEAVAVENALGRASLSFQTKITRSKKHGREFVISLVEKLMHTSCTQDCNQGRTCTCAKVPDGTT
jgi:hypothetical protein